ncbi:hypothetical protein [Pelobacter propionicus]|uniref:hypothetical protein n=1 Tax=Pelobacter propionicus TaxID=29543 RepID=UPI000057B6F1|nr:hypothetical protein [Pelobacter propionicus]
MKHPYHDYTLADALALATTLKKDRLIKDMKPTEARTMTPFTVENIEEAIAIMKLELRLSSFNWITGRVALELLLATNGESVTFIP